MVDFSVKGIMQKYMKSNTFYVRFTDNPILTHDKIV